MHGGKRSACSKRFSFSEDVAFRPTTARAKLSLLSVLRRNVRNSREHQNSLALWFCVTRRQMPRHLPLDNVLFVAISILLFLQNPVLRAGGGVITSGIQCVSVNGLFNIKNWFECSWLCCLLAVHYGTSLMLFWLIMTSFFKHQF